MIKKRGWRQQQEYMCDLKKRLLRDKYQATYEEWFGRFSNDKALFCRIYEIILEELENMKGVKSNYIRVAVMNKMAEDNARLDRIIDQFLKLEGGERKW
ncbi:MAG TPA: hypothetical protein HPP54_09740 [Nitrospinae bacterium]|nr:hypothetical protein [Nitrospinota bacterium]